MSNANIPKPSQKKLTPFKIIVIYLLVAGLWIILSDKLLISITSDSTTLTKLQTMKGWLFVVVTAGLLYVLIARYTLELTQAEKIVRKSEERYRRLTENSPDMIYRMSLPEARYEYVSPASTQLFGYSPEEFYNAPLLIQKVIAPAWQDYFKKQWENLLAGSIPESYEYQIIHKSGAVKSLHQRNVLITDNNGLPVAIEGIVTDITEQKKLHDMIVKAKEDWEASFDIINDAITIHDDNFNIIRANKAATELLGLPFLEVGWQKCFEAYHGSLCPPAECPSCQSLKSGKPSVTEFFEPHLKKYIEVKAFPRFDENKRLIGLIHVVRDITEHKKLEDQYLHTQKMEAIGTLSGGIAHDFNNILSVIMGFGEMMQMEMKKDDPLKDYLNQILAAAGRATHLTQSLLAFSRKQIIELKQVALNDIVRSVQKMLSRIIGEDVELRTHLTEAQLTIMADYSQIEQVLMNLATNARAAMPEGGELLIETGFSEVGEDFITTHGFGQIGDYAILSVTDTGLGMDEKIREKIFEPFFTTKEPGRGTGLGLSIVYGIIKQHSGYIDVYSEPGKGTTFKIYLPRVKAEADETETAVPPPVQGGTETVLVAEDYEAVRKLTSDMLQNFGYTVIVAKDGEDAINQFMKYRDKIELLLLDVIMPKKNGKEAYEEIRKVKPGIKVLFMSGYTADLINRRGMLDDGLNFIPKPVSANTLLRKIREVLDK